MKSEAGVIFTLSMGKIARLSGCSEWIDLEVVERETTPSELMRLGIRLNLAGLSLSNTVQELCIFGVERAQSTVHNWVHKADLQPEDGCNPDQIAVDETVIRLGDEQYWLYAAFHDLIDADLLRTDPRHQDVNHYVVTERGHAALCAYARLLRAAADAAGGPDPARSPSADTDADADRPGEAAIRDTPHDDCGDRGGER